MPGTIRVVGFRGWRGRKGLDSRIPSLPYDVVDTEEARRLAEGDPYTFLHIVKPEIDLEPGIDPYDDRVYARASYAFHEMIERGWLVRDTSPALYVYLLEGGGHRQIGIVGAVSVDDYLEGRIRRHESTREDKEIDRTRHIEAISAHAGPVFLTFRPVPEIGARVAEVVRGLPETDFVAPDGVRHALWKVGDPVTRDEIARLFSAVPRAYIADGHHRAAAAARVAECRRRMPGGKNGSPRAGVAPSPRSHDYFLAVLFPTDQVRILEYNRLVRDLGELDAEALLARVREAGFRIEADPSEPRPLLKGTFGMFLDGRWYRLTAPALGEDRDPVESLDAAVLTERLLRPVLGIGDVRTDHRLGFVGGVRGTGELEQMVRSRAWAVAFTVYPADIEDVLRVADAGRVMPPKSTWFEPKLRSGMVVYSLDGESL